jgi:hypothetical protein
MTHMRHIPQVERTEGARAPLSAFVIAYNREQIIGTCLRALAFADEVIAIDKGSTDGTLAIAGALADRVISVPWTPTVEETRAFAAAQCKHDWVLFLDDDECLSAEAVRFLDAELVAPRADIYRFPVRHYIMGRHDERAFYWPEHQTRMFRRGSVAFGSTVHDGVRTLSNRVHTVPPETGACIHHLSHRDVAQFIEKTNRYTAQPDRRRSPQTGTGLARFAHDRIDHWLARTEDCEPDAYPVAVALLRATYDLIDRLKTWEEEAAIDGAAMFRSVCAGLDASYEAALPDLARAHGGSGLVETAQPTQAAAADQPMLRAVEALRDSVGAQREAVDAMRADLEAARLRETEQRERAAEMQGWAENSARLAAEFQAKLGEFSRHHDATLARQEEVLAAERAARTAERDAARIACATELAALGEALAQATARAEAAEHRFGTIEASTSWRITAPLRAVLMRLGRR